MGTFVIGYDVGTTGLKTCLFEITDTIRLVASAMEGYQLTILENGGAEQDPNDWWRAMCNTTKHVLESTQISPDRIEGISFCSQSQGLVLVDKAGEPVRPAMSYMDQRSHYELKKAISHGLQISGINVYMLIRSLMVTGAISGSVKDPVYKYKWVERNEPEVFKKVYKWLDVKEYLICKCTGKFVTTNDGAFATLLYDVRKGKEQFSKEICKMFGVNMNHLPEIMSSTSIVGTIRNEMANQLGLKEGTPVFGGGMDSAITGVGAGAVELGSTYIYCGTSGWVSTVVDRQVVDIGNLLAGLVGVQKGYFNYWGELETAGKCLEWVKNHLALDEIDIYLEKKHISDSPESVFKNLYDYMMHAIKNVPAGSNGVIFTPWLHGNRCPFESPNARGMFFNISVNTGKTEMIHAVLEGICYHLRWILESQEKKTKTSEVIRFVGGGALAPLTCQLLSDILGRPVETVENPQNTGAVGAAILIGVGLGKLENIEVSKKIVRVSGKYLPDKNNKLLHDRNFKVFKTLFKSNQKNFDLLNRNA